MREVALLVMALVITGMVLISPSHAALPTAGSQLFFDDFTSSQINNAWSTQPFPSGNISQSGGYMTLIDTSVATLAVSSSTPNASAYGIVGLAADNVPTSPPIFDGNTPPGSFRYMSWKMQPFNLTSQSSCLGTGCLPNPSGSALVRNAELDFGLAYPYTVVNGGFYTGTFGFIGWKLVESDSGTSKQALFGQRQSIGIQLFTSSSATRCFDSIAVIEIASLACGPNNPAINYDGKLPIDLNAQHVFTMEMKVDFSAAANNWQAFQVDTNGWINVTNAACACIVPSLTPLVPFVQLAYCMGTLQNYSNHANCANVQAHQSVATSMDWVLVDDYVPASLPIGQLLGSGVTPPSVLPQPGVTGTLTGFLQFEANSISPGNLYAGGMLLTIMVSGTIFAVLFGVSKKFNISVRHYGLFFTMFVLALSFIGFYAAILPIWVPVMMVLITFGIAFGVIRTGNASGGLVPD